MEGLLEMTFRPSQHNVRFRSVFGSISGGFWDHFREVFGRTSGSEAVLKFALFSVAHFDAFRVHLGSPTAPMLAPFSGLWGGRDLVPPRFCCDAVSFSLLARFRAILAPENCPKIDPMEPSVPKMVPKSTRWSHLGSKMVPKSTRWRHLGYYCYYCYCGYY